MPVPPPPAPMPPAGLLVTPPPCRWRQLFNSSLPTAPRSLYRSKTGRQSVPFDREGSGAGQPGPISVPG